MTPGNTYYVLFVTNVTGSQQENDSTNDTNDVLAVPVTVDAPQLAVTQAQGPSSGAALIGTTIPVSWTVTNQSTTSPAPSPWRDAVYLSTTTTLDSSARLLQTYNAPPQSPLAPQGSYQGSDSALYIPTDVVPGAYNLLFVTNVDNLHDSNLGQPETDTGSDTDNVQAVPLTIQAPDLQVTGLDVQPAPTQSGSNVTVTWNDSNTGNGLARGSWTDLITVQNGSFPDLNYYVPAQPAKVGLAAGDALPQQFTFQLPNGAAGAGDLAFTVTTDVGNNITEANTSGTGETNNTSDPKIVHSTLAPYADLQPINLGMAPPDAASGLQSGTHVVVSWNDQNVGNAATSAAYYDYVLVQKVNADNSLSYIASGTVAGPSLAGNSTATTQQQFPFTLPNGSAGTGDIRVTVTTDYGQNLLEYDSNGNLAYGNNTASIDATSTLAPYADLKVQDSSLAVDNPASLQSGAAVTVGWVDQNVGNAATSGSYYDYVLVQKVNADNSLSYIASGTVAGPSLAASATATSRQQFPFTLPNGSAGTGDIRITVTTDYGPNLQEYDSSGNPAYGNNTATFDTTSTLAPYADLKVQDSSLAVDSPASLQSGAAVTVGWVDQNVGNAATFSAYYDYVLVQKVNADNSLSYIASGFVAGPSLAANSSSTTRQQFPFTLPNGAAGAGDIRITVTTDYGPNLQEYDSSGNPAYGNNTASIDQNSTLALPPTWWCRTSKSMAAAPSCPGSPWPFPGTT